MNTLAASLSLLFAASTLAQEVTPRVPREEASDSATAWKQVAKRLREASQADRVAFEAKWHWESGTMGKLRKVPGAEGAVQLERPRRNGKDTSDRALGICYHDGFRVVFAAPRAVEFVQVGARSLARVGKEEWQARTRSDLKGVDFVPDPQLLLRDLLEAEPEVLDRSIDDLDGKPYEFVSLNLSVEDVQKLVGTGALREPDQRAAKFREVAERQGFKGQINEPPILDVSLAFDVATKKLVRVHVRALVKQLDTRAALRKLGGRGGQPAPEKEESSDAAPAVGTKPTEFRHGLPVRKATDLLLLELEYVFGEPGAGPPRELSSEQKKLLGG